MAEPHINELRNRAYDTMRCYVCQAPVNPSWTFQKTAMCNACAVGPSDEAWLMRLEMELDSQP